MNAYYFKFFIFISINQLHCQAAILLPPSYIYRDDESLSCAKDNEQCRCEPMSLDQEQISVECENIKLSYIPEIINKKKKYRMNLNQNKITTLAAGMLNGLQELENFSLNSNEITVIENNTFSHMNNLLNLYLNDNKITQLTPRMFDGLNNLRMFTISSNGITIIENNTFSEMRNLNTLYLNNNKITKLTPGMLNGLNELRELSINSNRIAMIEDNTFSHMNNLLYLSLNDNKITHLKQGTFVGSNNLSMFTISSNGITIIEDYTFSHMSNLKKLYLRNNNITKLTPRKFYGLKMLNMLAIGWNGITVIENNTFSQMSNLNKLYMNNNKITKLTPGMLDGLKELQEFIIDSNEITFIEDNTFRHMKNLLYLYLNDNKMTKLTPGMFNGLTMLSIFTITSNKITIIKNYTFSQMSNLNKLFLSDNKITKLTPGMFDGLKMLSTFAIASNGITIIEDNTFSHMSNLSTLYLSNNEIHELRASTFQNLHNLGYLLLERNKIKTTENNVFKELVNLRKLNLSSNEISELPAGIFYGLEKLEMLTLENNAIKKIENDVFKNVKNLKELNLAQNSIIWNSGKIFDNTTMLNSLTSDEYRLCCLLMKRNLLKCIPTVDQCRCNELVKDTVLRFCIRIIGIVAIFANLFVIVYRTKYNKFYTNKINSLLIRNLAISDLFMGFYLLIIVIADTVFINNYNEKDFEWRSSVWCHLAGMMSTFSSSLTAFTLMIITIERVLATISPFRTKLQEIYQVKIAITIAWTVAVIIAIIPLQVFSIKYFENFYSRSGICLPLHMSSNKPNGWHYSIFIFLVLYSAALTMMLLSYMIMYQSTKKIRQAVSVSNDKSLPQMVMIFRMTLFVLADATCKIPIIILGIQSLSKDRIEPITYQWLALFVTPLNAALNPILYTLSSLPSAFRFIEYLQSLKFRSPIIVKVKYRSPVCKKSGNQITEIENGSSNKTTHKRRRKKELS